MPKNNSPALFFYKKTTSLFGNITFESNFAEVSASIVTHESVAGINAVCP